MAIPQVCFGVSRTKWCDLPQWFRRKTRRALWKRDGRACFYCKALLSEEAATVDHVVPVSKGGAVLDMDNMVCCCQPCNVAKGDWLPDV